MMVFVWTTFYAHVDDKMNAKRAEFIIVFGRWGRADEEVLGDGREVHVRNGNIGWKAPP